MIDFAAARLNQRTDDLLSRAVGMTTLAVCRTGCTCWVERADADLTTNLDAALSATSRGYAHVDPCI